MRLPCRENYEVRECRHKSSILKFDFPCACDEIIEGLESLRLYKRQPSGLTH